MIIYYVESKDTGYRKLGADDCNTNSRVLIFATKWDFANEFTCAYGHCCALEGTGPTQTVPAH